MKQKMLSVFLALALTASLLPTAAFAEDADELSSPPAQSIDADEPDTPPADPVDADNPDNPDNPSEPDTPPADPVDADELDEPDTPPADSIDLAAAAVQALIDALPTAESVTAADYDAVQDAYDAYDALSEEQQAQIIGAEVFEALFAWFNGQTAPIADSITYIGATGNETETNYIELTVENISSVTSGTYLVNSSLTVGDNLPFTGDTTLILGSNATLTVDGVLSCTGNLTITTVTGATNATLTVNGGTGTDGDGKVNGYGIYSGKSLNIYAGTVNATGGNVTADSTNSYGIYVAYGSLTISGSGTSVTATGGTASNESYGIRRADGSNSDSICITGGTVEATGGTATLNNQTVAGSWSFTDTGASFQNVTDSRDSVSVTFTPADTTNFNAATTTITITINKAMPTGAPKYTAITTSGKTLVNANLTTVDGTFSVPGTVKWIDADGNDLADTTGVAANTAYKWLFTPTDTTNYNTLTGSITLWHRSSSGGFQGWHGNCGNQRQAD